MIRCDHPRLSLSRQCRLLSVSRSSLYHRPKGENARNLGLMRRIDELFLEYRSTAAARWSVICGGKASVWVVTGFGV